MPYVKRGESGIIVAVSDQPLPDFAAIDADSDELQQYAARLSHSDAPVRGSLDQTDQDFIRVVEDVIELLIDKNIILFTDLPDAAQAKMLQRKRLRATLPGNRLDLWSDDDDSGL